MIRRGGVVVSNAVSHCIEKKKRGKKKRILSASVFSTRGFLRKQ